MLRINYRIDDIRALLALAQHGNFVLGAKSLHITQSAFSRRIAQLEEVVGARLVERTSRRVALTQLGQTLAEQARLFLPQLDQSIQDAYKQARGESGSVTLACLTTVAYSRLPAVLGQFRETFPNVSLRVRDVSADIADLDSRRIIRRCSPLRTGRLASVNASVP